MKIKKSELRTLVEEVMNEKQRVPNHSVPAWMISGKSNVEVGFHNGLKALEKVTTKMEKEGYGDKSLHQKIQQKFKELKKLGDQIGYVETGKEGRKMRARPKISPMAPRQIMCDNPNCECEDCTCNPCECE